MSIWPFVLIVAVTVVASVLAVLGVHTLFAQIERDGGFIICTTETRRVTRTQSPPTHGRRGEGK